MSNRLVKSLSILGVDNNLSDSAVSDGACQEIHNLRNNRGEWDSCCEMVNSYPISNNPYPIIHKHKVLPDGEFITLGITLVCHTQISSSGVVEHTTLTEIDATKPYNITSYGNLLHVSQKVSGTIYLDSVFVYNKQSKEYKQFDLNSISMPIVTISDYDYDYESLVALKDVNGDNLRSIPLSSILFRKSVKDGITTKEFLFNVGMEDKLTGSYLFFVGYRMFDGSVVKVSDILKINGISNDDLMYRFYKKGRGEIDQGSPIILKQTIIEEFYKVRRSSSPIISIVVDQDFIDSDMFSKIVIFATRNIPELLYSELGKDDFDLDLPGRPNPGATSVKLYDETINIGSNEGETTVSIYRLASYSIIINPQESSIAETPFYEVATLNKDETSFTFDYEKHFKHIETQPIYKAGFGNHKRWGIGKLYYNNRLHEFDNKFKLADSIVTIPKGTSSKKNIITRVTLSIDGLECVVGSQQSVDSVLHEDVSCIQLPRIVSYPDARATHINIFYGSQKLLDRPLIAAYSNNISYANITEDEEYKPLIESTTLPLLKDINNIYYIDDIIYISNTDNPFYFTPKHTLTANKDFIKRIAVSIDQLPEAKFGENPLYIFTDNGISIAETGGAEVLYSRIIPLNFDVVKNTTPIVILNGALIYISDAGVVLVEGRNYKIISTSLHDRSKEFLSYIKDCDFGVYYAVYDEVLLYNSVYNYAYIFSFSNNTWSTRNFSPYNIISHREISNEKGIFNLSLEEDYTKPLSWRLTTRPIKFGNREFKRLDTFVANMKSKDFNIIISGSNDLVNWSVVRAGQILRLRRANKSYRYLRVSMNAIKPVANISPNLDHLTTITTLDFEYYHRFVNHIR